MQNIHQKIPFCFEYISGSRGGGVISDLPWHDVGARNALVTRGLIFLQHKCDFWNVQHPSMSSLSDTGLIGI